MSKPASEIIYQTATGLTHECIGRSSFLAMGISLRCEFAPKLEFGTSYVVDSMVTCLACIGAETFPAHCQYCGVYIGDIPYLWATEDVCAKCAR